VSEKFSLSVSSLPGLKRDQPLKAGLLSSGKLKDSPLNKWLGAIKSAEGSQRLTSTNEKEHLHAQNEDQERR
jgi:hypothetical protein